MSLLQNQDYVLHRLRTRYLNSMRDGIGERLITLNPTVFNVPGYKNAGWPNTADLTSTQTYSPPIPAGSSMDYFAAVPKLRDKFQQQQEEGEDGEMQRTAIQAAPVLQTGSLDLPTVLGKKSGRSREPGAASLDDDSSDLSDESDVDDDLNRAAQQIKFSKMPIRQRAGSSPTRSSNPHLMVTSPGKTTETRLRSGSHGTMELEKRKSIGRREDTLEMLSHTIDQNTKAFKEIAQQLRRSPVSSFRDNAQNGNDFDSDADSDDDASSTLSSDFTETGDSHPTILSNSSMSPAPVAPLFSNLDSKANEIAQSLDPLPPPRPISQLLPVSALTQLIKANEEEISHPLDAFTVFAGKGDLKAGAPTAANPRARHGPQRDAGGGGGGGPLKLKIYRPTSKKPSTPWEVVVKRFVVKDGKDSEVTVADTIGYSLYRYREEELEPPLTEEQYSINKWTFRIVEDDGEPDYDFPALDRTRAISAFSLDELALVEATQAQYEEYEKKFPTKKVEKEKKPEIKPSTDLASTAERVAPRAADAPAQTSTSSARTGAPQTLKIYVNTPEVFDQSVTVRVTSDTYNAEVLDIICRKKHLDRSRHTLRIPKLHTIVPLDRTVESLQGRSELELVVKRFIDFVGDRPNSPSTTDPNTPLFAGKSSGKTKPTLLSQTANTSDMLLGAGYQKFTVWRKMPMSFISRHERILAIDGEYVHIMPSDSNKTLFESPKTTSIHISALIGCKASRKAPTNFKLIVMKSREWKRYVFEASSAAQATEIVGALKTKLMDYRKSTNF